MRFVGCKAFIFFFIMLYASLAQAATQSVTVSVAFETSLTVTTTSNISLGTLKANSAGSYVIAPNGQVTAKDGGAVLGGEARAASLTISGSPTQSINISTGNYISSHGVTPSHATCSYAGGGAVPCSLVGQAAPGPGATLLVGIAVDVDGSQEAGSTASPSFDIIVSYQ